MDNLSQTDVILSKCCFIPHNFRRDAWWNLWSSGSYWSLDSQNKMALPSMYRRRLCHILTSIDWENRLQLSHKVSQQVLLQYISHTAETDKVSLVFWSTVSQNLRPLRAARTMWVYFALCQQSTLKKSKLGVRLVLEVLAKLMVRENLSWEFPKVGMCLILEVRLILETRRYMFMFPLKNLACKGLINFIH